MTAAGDEMDHGLEKVFDRFVATHGQMRFELLSLKKKFLD